MAYSDASNTPSSSSSAPAPPAKPGSHNGNEEPDDHDKVLLASGPDWNETGLVFTAPDGQGLHPDYVSKHFQTLIARHGLPTITLHGLRHLAASLQIAAGIDIAVVSKRLRHSSIKITSDTYVHLIGTIGRQAAEAAAFLVPLQRNLSVMPSTDASVNGAG